MSGVLAYALASCLALYVERERELPHRSLATLPLAVICRALIYNCRSCRSLVDHVRIMTAEFNGVYVLTALVDSAPAAACLVVDYYCTSRVS